MHSHVENPYTQRLEPAPYTQHDPISMEQLRLKGGVGVARFTNRRAKKRRHVARKRYRRDFEDALSVGLVLLGE